MGLFSKEACIFCGKEVGMMHRSKLQTKEYICNDCRNKTHPFARMDYTSRTAAEEMMASLPQEVAWMNEEIARLEAEKNDRVAIVQRKDFDLGSKRVHYSCVRALGIFRLEYSDLDHYKNHPPLYFDHILPYRFTSGGEIFSDIRRTEIMDAGANYVTVNVSKDSDGRINKAEIVIPYQDDCIREIKISSSVDSEVNCKPFYALAERINDDRRGWLSKLDFDVEQKNRMQVRNLGDTAAAALKAAVKGESVEEAVKEGIDTANDIEAGKVKQGFFGKLFKK